MLFRQQAVDAAHAQTYGTVLLSRPLSSWAIVGAGCTAMLMIFAALAFGTYTRKFTAAGILVPEGGIVKVASPESGVVEAVLVGEGHDVHRGQALFQIRMAKSSQLRDDSQADILGTIRARRASLKSELSTVTEALRIRFVSASRKTASRHAEELLLSQQRDLQLKRATLAKEDYDRYLGLVNQNFVGSAQADAKMAVVIEQQERLNELDRSIAEAARERASDDEDLDAAKAAQVGRVEAIRREVQALEEQEADIDARHLPEVRAAIDGRIWSFGIHVGDAVSQGQPLADLVPVTGETKIEMYVAPGDMSSLHVGQRIVVKYSAYPYQNYGTDIATVDRISEVPVHGAPTDSGAADHAGRYRVTARLDPPTPALRSIRQTLRPGATLDCVMEAETHRLYQWLLVRLDKTSVHN